MFCSKCGMKNEDGAQFCSGCGASLIGDQRGEEIQQRQSEREELIKKLQQVLPGLQRVEAMDEQLQDLEAEKQALSVKVKGHLGRNLGIFIGVYFVLACVLRGIISGIFLMTSALYMDSDIAAISSGAIAIVSLIVGIAIFVGGILIIINMDKSSRKKYEGQLYNVEDKIHELSEQRDLEVQKVLPEIQFIPENYRYSIAVQYMLDAFRNQRADTFKEAINLYEEQLHRWKLENASEQMLTLQRQQMSELNRINANTTVSAIANTITAFNTK